MLEKVLEGEVIEKGKPVKLYILIIQECVDAEWEMEDSWLEFQAGSIRRKKVPLKSMSNLENNLVLWVRSGSVLNKLGHQGEIFY